MTPRHTFPKLKKTWVSFLATFLPPNSGGICFFFLNVLTWGIFRFLNSYNTALSINQLSHLIKVEPKFYIGFLRFFFWMFVANVLWFLRLFCLPTICTYVHMSQIFYELGQRDHFLSSRIKSRDLNLLMSINKIKFTNTIYINTPKFFSTLSISAIFPS